MEAKSSIVFASRRVEGLMGKARPSKKEPKIVCTPARSCR
jgi:hypothetical protein